MTQPIQPVVTDPELAENFSADFTDLPLSPVTSRASRVLDDFPPTSIVMSESNPFGGFSFVASKSLLEDDFMMLDGCDN